MKDLGHRIPEASWLPVMPLFLSSYVLRGLLLSEPRKVLEGVIETPPRATTAGWEERGPAYLLCSGQQQLLPWSQQRQGTVRAGVTGSRTVARSVTESTGEEWLLRPERHHLFPPRKQVPIWLHPPSFLQKEKMKLWCGSRKSC